MNQAHRPLPIKTINAAGKILSRAGIENPLLNAENIFAKGHNHAKCEIKSDYTELKKRLQIFCESLELHAKLNQTGRLLTYFSLVNTVKNRIQIDHWLSTHPEVSKREIKKPVFILGLPRTGTTALFNMLASLDGMRAPLGWEINKPVPPVVFANKDSDPRIQQTHREFEAFFYLTPTLRVIHDFGALLPQECLALTQYDMYSGQLWFSYQAPEYLQWYQQQNPLESFRFHKQFIQLLQSDFPKQRWLFKTPFHLSSLEQIFEIYPDAQIIQTHRDPMEVMASTCSFCWHLRSTFSDQVDNAEIGKLQLNFWSQALKQSVQDREKLKHKASQFYDVDYRQFISNPVETVSGVLDFLGENKNEHISQQLITHAEQNQKDKHGKHIYQLQDYGLDALRDKPVFEDYCKRFNL
jgi:hypothetical protein